MIVFLLTKSLLKSAHQVLFVCLQFLITQTGAGFNSFESTGCKRLPPVEE